jgi:hypothetical protein
MTPARSLAASVAALGFASALTAAPPAFAAPAPCERAENYAALSGAELLRIDRLEVRTPDAAERPPIAGGPGATKRPSVGDGSGAAERPSVNDDSGTTERPSVGGRAQPERGAVSAQDEAGATDRILGAAASPIDPTDETGEDSDTLSEGIGMLGEAALDSVVPGGAGAVTDPDAPWKALENADAGNAGSMIAEKLPLNKTGAVHPAGLVNRATLTQPGGSATAETTGKDTADDEPSEAALPQAGSHAGGEVVGQAGGQAAGQAGGKAAGQAGRKGVGQTAAEGGKSTVVRGIGLGESRTALVGTAQVKSAALARILDGTADGKAAWSEPVLQQAPPTNAEAATRGTPAGRLGPLQVGAGAASAHASWSAEMACGSTTGEAARSSASMRGASVVGSGDTALVRVPERVESSSTTALERRGELAWTVASAAVNADQIDLAGGRVRVRVLRPPTLAASMSTSGGKIDYRPAQVEISGEGLITKRLDRVGERIDVTLGPDRRGTESGMAGLGDVRPGSALRLPSIPGLPQLGTSAAEQLPGLSEPASATEQSGLPESASGAGQSNMAESASGAGQSNMAESASGAGGTRLRISLGGVRQARKGHAIAARATAIKVSVARSAATKGRGKIGYGGKPSTAVSLDLSFGLMETVAVAPETPAYQGTSGAGGGLPITGPQAVGLAVGGLALLLGGIVAVLLSIRRRRFRS